MITDVLQRGLKDIDKDCGTDHDLHYNLRLHQEGGGTKWAAPGGGWDDQWLLKGGPPFSP